MATTKKRLNITLDAETEKFISILAKRDNVPEATKAAELLREAIEIEEDKIWIEIAESRDTPAAEYISHEEIWKKYGIK